MTTDIESQYKSTHDEHARQRFVSRLRRRAIVDLRAELERHYDGVIEPKLNANDSLPESWRDIQSAMENEHVYRFYSTMRYNAQEMCFMSVQPTIERNLPAMIESARTAANDPQAGGSLSLSPDLKIPPYVTQLDVHLAPGYTHLEHREDDVAQGAVITFGGKIFTGQHPDERAYGSVGRSVAQWLKRRFDGLNVQSVLDMGTCSGKNLLPFSEVFSDAALHGVDVGAPVLRYGHAWAENEGLAVQFSQQNAEHTNFPDASFDVITSSFFLHEIPVKATRNVLAECHRLLKPGGVMIHMELPNETAATHYQNFFWNWDTRNNNEPFYTQFRSQDVEALTREAGFAADATFANLIPDFGMNGEDFMDACVAGTREAPMHGRGGWFVFGGRKSA